VKLSLNYPIYPDLTHPKGFLSRDLRAQACWYFYTLAEKMRVKVGDGIESQMGTLLEGELWMETRYEQLARSVAMIYKLESPDEFMKAWDQVKQQAESMGYPTPHPAYTNPIRLRLH
jgi:hypothetical protein